MYKWNKAVATKRMEHGPPMIYSEIWQAKQQESEWNYVRVMRVYLSLGTFVVVVVQIGDKVRFVLINSM